MPIPQDLHDLADKETDTYKEYIGLAGTSRENSELSGPSLEAHRRIETSTQLGLGKGRKKQKADKGGKKKLM